MDPSPFELHLNSNYIPTSPEIDAIRVLINDQRLEVDAIDQKLADLDRQRKELKTEKSVRTEFIARHYALTTIVRTLPDDIIATLFTTLLSISEPMTSPHPSVVVSHVCHRWRDISLRTPVLWADIEIYTPRPTLNDADWENRWGLGLESIADKITVFFGRSGLYPLSLWVDIQDLVPNMFVQMRGRGNLMTPVNAALLLCTGKGWRRMTISSWVNTIQPNISLLLAGSLTVLSQRSGGITGDIVLDVTYTPWVRPIPDDEWERLTDGMLDFASNAVSLPTLTILAAKDTLCRIPANWGALTTLSIGNRNDTGGLPADYILSVLSKAESLVTLTLEVPRQICWQAPPPPHHPAEVSLPHLLSFTIRGFSPTWRLLAGLDLPRLKRLGILPAVREDTPIPWHDGHLITANLTTRYGKHLVELEVNCVVVPPHSLLLMLHTLPSLKLLELTSYDGPGHPMLPEDSPILSILVPLTPIFEEQRSKLKKKCLCPSLSDLKVGLETVGPPVTESILKLIEARRKVKGGPVAWRERIEVVFRKRWSEGMLDELARRGVPTRGVHFGLRCK